MQYIKPLSVGNVTLTNNLMLAPLAGVTMQPFRVYAKRFGAGLVCTEMIACHGLVHQNKKTAAMIDIADEERPVSVQIFGNDPQAFGAAAQMVEDMGADIVDINMGCPAPKIVNNMSGAALLKDTQRVRAIVQQVVKNVKKIPVTVKMRAGWDDKSINAEEVARILEGEGAALITVHARTRAQRFGFFDWGTITRVKQVVHGIPVIGNGNVVTPEDAKKMFEQTGCDGIMIGRGALHNPWIFREIVEYLQKGTYTEVSIAERFDYAYTFAETFVKYRGERPGIFEVRSFLGWLFKKFPDASSLRKQCFATTTLDELLSVLRTWNL